MGGWIRRGAHSAVLLGVFGLVGCPAPDEEADQAMMDASLTDATLPDAPQTDAALPDAALPDATLPDAALPDAALPDAALPDAALPDAALPDAALPDAALPDAALPDAALPDAMPPDPGGPVLPFCGALACPPDRGCAPCAVVYVRADAAPDGDGSAERPFQTISAGVVAVGQGAVLVAAGEYAGPIDLPDGVSIHGGHDAAWAPGDAPTTVRTPAGDDDLIAVMAHDIQRGAGLERLTLVTDAAAPGRSTYGVVAERAPALRLHHLDVRPGSAGAGVDGGDGMAGQAGGDGADARFGSLDFCTDLLFGGDAGENPACPIANGADGGANTFGLEPAGPLPECDGDCPPWGADGAPGVQASDSIYVPLVDGRWRGRAGQSGANGSPSRGGRPGAVLLQGAEPVGTGGGAAGGCAGTAGIGGGAGGGSFALVAVDSPGLRVRESSLRAGAGGEFGRGGAGGPGGAGGVDGVGRLCVWANVCNCADCPEELSCQPLPGRAAAAGGAGGHGSDGTLGPSIAVVCDGAQVVFEATDLEPADGPLSATSRGCCLPDEAARCEAAGGVYDPETCGCSCAAADDCTNPAERCGDGRLNGVEACDDGNDDELDGCTTTCTVGPLGVGYACDPAAPRCVDGAYCGDDARCVAHRCGDGLQGPGEECDDANDDDEDGCTRECVIDLLGQGNDCGADLPECSAGLFCDGEGMTCQPHECGDGQRTGDEACDDALGICDDACACRLGPADLPPAAPDQACAVGEVCGAPLPAAPICARCGVGLVLAELGPNWERAAGPDGGTTARRVEQFFDFENEHITIRHEARFDAQSRPTFYSRDIRGSFGSCYFERANCAYTADGQIALAANRTSPFECAEGPDSYTITCAYTDGQLTERLGSRRARFDWQDGHVAQVVEASGVCRAEVALEACDRTRHVFHTQDGALIAEDVTTFRANDPAPTADRRTSHIGCP